MSEDLPLAQALGSAHALLSSALPSTRTGVAWDASRPDRHAPPLCPTLAASPHRQESQCDPRKDTTVKPMSTSSRRCRSPSHIPRPRNAFMIYRSEFYKHKPIDSTVEHDHRLISRIIGHCWKQLSDDERAAYKTRAKEEADLHKLKYPNYRFKPVHRTTPPQRRKVKRNGPKDEVRCQEIASLIRAGYHGSDLERATKRLDVGLFIRFDKQANRVNNHTPTSIGSWRREPVFRSPLLAPITIDGTVDSDRRSATLQTNAGSTSPLSSSLPLQSPSPRTSPWSVCETVDGKGLCTLDSCDGSSSSLINSPVDQQLVHATTTLLYQNQEEPFMSPAYHPLPQYLPNISHPLASPGLFPEHSTVGFSDRSPLNYSPQPTYSYHHPSHMGLFASHVGHRVVSTSGDWGLEVPSSHQPTTASEAASQRISMVAQLHGHLHHPPFVPWTPTR